MNKLLYGLGFFFMITGAMFLVLGLIFLIATPPAGVAFIAGDLAVMYLGAYLFETYKLKDLGRDEVKIGPCSSCSLTAPTRFVEFKECRAYLVYRRERSYEGYTCAICADKIYKTFTSTNLKLGWWSAPGLMRTPMMLMVNYVNHRRTKAMAAIGPDSAAQAAVRQAVQ